MPRSSLILITTFSVKIVLGKLAEVLLSLLESTSKSSKLKLRQSSPLSSLFYWMFLVLVLVNCESAASIEQAILS